MKQAYRVLAFLIAAGVMLQAAAIAYGMFGLFKWVENGGTIDQSTELTPDLGGYTGFSLHAIGRDLHRSRDCAAVLDQLVLRESARRHQVGADRFRPDGAPGSPWPLRS